MNMILLLIPNYVQDYAYGLYLYVRHYKTGGGNTFNTVYYTKVKKEISFLIHEDFSAFLLSFYYRHNQII